MADAKPYPKSAQLSRGERRYRRKVASPKQWQAIIAAKGNVCRLRNCLPALFEGEMLANCDGLPVQYHHLVPRDQHGDDTADNIVPLCQRHHGFVTLRDYNTAHALAALLTDAEYAYVVGKLGEGGMERLFGVNRG